MTEAGQNISVEIIYARPNRQKSELRQFSQGTTARQAVSKTSLLQIFPEIDPLECPLGVWGAEVSDTYQLQNGDRLEIYRPLINDPRDTRRRLAAEGKTMGSGKESI